MFKLRLTDRAGLALIVCLALVFAAAFAGLARTARAEDDGMTPTMDMSEIADDADQGDIADDADQGDIASAPDSADMPDANEDDDDKPIEGDDEGEILTTGADEGEILTTGADGETADAETSGEDDEDEAEEAAREKRIKLYTVIAAVLALAVVIVVYFAFRSKSETKAFTTRQLVESAIMIAIGTVLSLIKIDSPFGGGVTIVSMLPLVLISHRWGWRWGVVTAFVYSVIQLMLGLDNVAYATSFMMAVGIILLDYIVAYSVIGLSGVFGKSRSAVAIGIAVTFTLRFICHWITGGIIWDVWMPDEFWGLPMTNPWVYSAMYNGWYMAIELVATEIIAMLIYKPLEKFIRNEN